MSMKIEQKIEQILERLPAENHLNMNVAVILKKLMEGIVEITESRKEDDILTPLDVIQCVSLAGAALISDIADKADDEAAQYTMLSEYAKQSFDSAMLMLGIDFSSMVDRIDDVIGKMDQGKKKKRQ